MTPEIKNKLAEFAKAADEQGILSTEQLEIIYRQKWFKLFVPKENGGLELVLPEGLETEEALARIDGSLGWTVTLCSGATEFIGYLPKTLSEKVLCNEKVCFGGSGAVTGTATETKDHYVINGFWKYATGAPYCTHFTANCLIQKNGKTLLNKEGEPVFKSFLFTKAEVQIYKDWNTMGLKATASHSFSVKDLKINKERAFIIDAKHSTLPGLIYQYPFLQFAETTLAVNISGMALHFLDEFEQLVTQWDQSKKYSGEVIRKLKEKFKKNNDNLMKHRALFYNAVNQSWKILQQKGSITVEISDKISLSSRELSCNARKVVSELYPHCGVAATQNGTKINLIFRDIFTASQHYLLNL
jgi:alkylation response protein AidB-like acyl-CoA dehydrogenase